MLGCEKMRKAQVSDSATARNVSKSTPDQLLLSNFSMWSIAKVKRKEGAKAPQMCCTRKVFNESQ